MPEDQCRLLLQTLHPTCKDMQTLSVTVGVSEAEVGGIQVVLCRRLWELILSPHVLCPDT